VWTEYKDEIMLVRHGRTENEFGIAQRFELDGTGRHLVRREYFQIGSDRCAVRVTRMTHLRQRSSFAWCASFGVQFTRREFSENPLPARVVVGKQ
jgi:hypothetical protein